MFMNMNAHSRFKGLTYTSQPTLTQEGITRHPGHSWKAMKVSRPYAMAP